MAQWGVKTEIPKTHRDFLMVAAEERPTQKLKWKTDCPVWVDQWSLAEDKLKALNELVEEQLAKGHIVPATSPWNSLVFLIRKPRKDKWRLLHDLRKINEAIEDMRSLQLGMPSLLMLPQNWNLAVINIKDCFFQIPLDPADAPRFSFSVPSINQEAPMKCYHWTVLPQGMKNSPSICQWVGTAPLEISGPGDHQQNHLTPEAGYPIPKNADVHLVTPGNPRPVFGSMDRPSALKECMSDPGQCIEARPSVHVSGSSRQTFVNLPADRRQLLREALPSLLADPETAIDENGNALTLEHLMGEGRWTDLTDQASSIPIKALQTIREHAVTAFFSMVSDGPVIPYYKIVQGTKEAFTKFVERLTRAIEVQVSEVAVREGS
ncbi:hypothetical protein DUI87_02480 [Hirundo rustica rustica]|uniref:ribonuclease H n=1 Tax=Hirundo rustica rustica TaxID=333673 RepID=A0A3M0L8H5_HIRRU|nr:hypothetical protein DUI87_02480 [Hirundo rustica rustica]